MLTPVAFIFLAGTGAFLYAALGILGIKRKHKAQLPMVLLLLLAAVGMLPPFLILKAPQSFFDNSSWMRLLIYSQCYIGTLLWHHFALLLPVNPGGISNDPEDRDRWFRLALSILDQRILIWLLYGIPTILLFFTAFDSVFPVNNSLEENALPYLSFVPPAWILFTVILALGRSLALRHLFGGVPELVFYFLSILSFNLLLVLSGLLGFHSLAIVGNLGMILLVLLYGYWIQRRPTLLGIGRASAPSDDDLSRIIQLRQKLDAFMESERPYLDEDLNRWKLSELTGISEREISQILNHRPEFGFTHYINRYRVADACRMLQSTESSHRSILDITYACGFNSKSVFYQAFRREKGITPSEYRNRNR